MATPQRFGTEFLINTTTADVQFTPDIAALADGRFVVTWADLSRSGDDASGLAVRAQVFNADGSKDGAEFLVNTLTDASQQAPAVTGLADGGFAIGWQDENFGVTGGDSGDGSVRAQVFDGQGLGAGDFLVNTSTGNAQNDPTITTLSDGRFVVAWTDASRLGQGDIATDIRAQIYNANGTVSGVEFVVNDKISGGQITPQITALSNGRFAVTWMDNSVNFGTPAGDVIKATIFSANGAAVTAEFQVNAIIADTQFDPQVAALANGRFVVTWTDNSHSPDDPSGFALRGQVFKADGSMAGAAFLVATTLSNDQQSSDMVGLRDGRFVVTWVDRSFIGGDDQGAGIKAQLFNANGTTSGAEFLVNTTIAGNQLDPSVTELADGRFVVAWSDAASDVFGQIYDPREAAIALTGGVLGDQFIGTRFGDTLSGGQGGDDLQGGAGADLLFGGKGNDTLAGGMGRDVLTGAAGRDVFVFDTAAAAGTVANPDRIADFAPQTDRIDLSGFMPGGSFIGAAAFTAAGQVRYAAGVLSGETTGDATADWAVALTGALVVHAGDLIF